MKHSLSKYVGFTFLISWLLWLPSVLQSTVLPDLPDIVGLFGMFSPLVPMLVAFYLVRQSQSNAGLTQFAKRAISLQFDKRWLIPTAIIFPIVGILTTLILSQIGELPDWSPVSPITAMITFFVILSVGGGLEEFGWRGYALDPLQNQFNPLVASLILGFIWGLWHLPLFFIEGTVQANIPVWQFILQTMVITILYTWLYNNTNGSLLIAILFHTIGNTTSALLPPYFATPEGRWINFGILLVIAATVWIVSLRKDTPYRPPH